MRLLGGARKAAVLVILHPHVVHVQLGLQRRRQQLVHYDVLSVELQTAHAILHVCLPSQRHVAQIEQLDVAIVVARRHAPVISGVRVAKAYGPRVSLRLGLGRLDDGHRLLVLSGVPDFDGAVAARRHDLGRALTNAQTADAIYGVDDLFVRFDRINRLFQLLQVPNVQCALKVARRQMSILNFGGAKCAALERLGFLCLK